MKNENQSIQKLFRKGGRILPAIFCCLPVIAMGVGFASSSNASAKALSRIAVVSKSEVKRSRKEHTRLAVAFPTASPTAVPTPAPTAAPTPAPTAVPTPRPTFYIPTPTPRPPGNGCTPDSQGRLVIGCIPF